MIKNILNLSTELIKIKSDPDNSESLEQALGLVRRELEGFTIEDFDKDGVKSILVHNQKIGAKKFKIILNGHLDVIPGKDFQYSPRIEDDKLYGVGSMDMKSNVACLVYAFKNVARNINYPLAIQVVTDEEIGGFKGTKYQVDQGVRADFVIAGETTNFNIVNKAKGIIWMKISCKGKTAHGAYPWRGKNAIWKMTEFLNKLNQKFPIPQKQDWVTTVNLSKIETDNQTFNKIPDNCVAWLDIRYIPEDKDTVIKKIKSILPANFKMEIVANEHALFIEESNHYVQLLKSINENVLDKKTKIYGAQGSSDARHFTKVGCGGIEFGPIGGGIGTDDEWVSIKSLEIYYKILVKFLESQT